MGQGTYLPGVPESVRNHPAFKEGAARQARGEGLPPAYYQEIERAAELIHEWYHSQPTPPDLRWLKEPSAPELGIAGGKGEAGEVFIAADLDVGAQYLADSPDAFRLLAWLDAKTEHRLSLNQAKWALRRVRALPMPDGTYYGTETVRESKAVRLLQSFGKDENASRVPPSPCPHCGVVLDACNSADGGKPEPGCHTICISCLNVSVFDDELRMAKVTQEEIDAMPAEHRAMLDDARGILRHYRAEAQLGGKGSRTVHEA